MKEYGKEHIMPKKFAVYFFLIIFNLILVNLLIYFFSFSSPYTIPQE